MARQLKDCLSIIPNETLKFQLMSDEDGYLKLFPESDRIALLTVAIVLCSFCIVGNCAAVFTVFRRKMRLFYKCCLISLAVSDLLLGLCYSAMYIPKFIEKYFNAWYVGEDMCFYAPLLMTMCLLINSMTISCIALDRYQAVRVGAKKRWEPNLWICLACMLLIWSACAGIATPMHSMYHYLGPIHFVTVDCDVLPNGMYFCTTPTKIFKNEYYLSVYILIFLPLFVTFVGLYVVIAMYVWKQRIPISKRAPAQTSSNETTTTSRSKNGIKMYNKSNTTPRYVMNTTSNSGSRSTLLTDSSSGTPLNRRRQSDNKAGTPVAEPPKSTTQTRRKVRTFKVIMVLIASCFIGRVPSWTYTVIQSNPNIRLAELKWWLLQHWFTMLSLLSTALNPFLYCFLNETLDFIQGVFRFIRNIFECCCCNRQTGNKMNVKTDTQQFAVEEEQIRTVSIVPRGPYLNDEENITRALAASVKVNHI